MWYFIFWVNEWWYLPGVGGGGLYGLKPSSSSIDFLAARNLLDFLGLTPSSSAFLTLPLVDELMLMSATLVSGAGTMVTSGGVWSGAWSQVLRLNSSWTLVTTPVIASETMSATSPVITRAQALSLSSGSLFREAGIWTNWIMFCKVTKLFMNHWIIVTTWIEMLDLRELPSSSISLLVFLTTSSDPGAPLTRSFSIYWQSIG